MPRMLSPSIRTMDTRTAKPAPKKADNFYLSKPWQDFRDTLLKERGRRCEKCGRTGTRIFGDHIVELKDGGEPFDRKNSMLLCGSCHSLKTIAERAKRMAQRF